MTEPLSVAEWLDLARATGSSGDDCEHSARGGTVVAMNALERVLGDRFLLSTAEVAMSDSRAAETARSVVGHVGPRCVVAPLAEIAGDEGRSESDRMAALDVLQVVRRREAADALYTLARSLEGGLHVKAAWALVQTLLDTREPIDDQEMARYLRTVACPSTRELAAVLLEDSKD